MVSDELWHLVEARRDDGTPAMFRIRDLEPRLDQPRIFVVELPYPATALSRLPDATAYRRLSAFEEQWLAPACAALGWTFVAAKTEDGSFFLYLYGSSDPTAMIEKLSPFDGALGFYDEHDPQWQEYGALRDLLDQANALPPDAVPEPMPPIDSDPIDAGWDDDSITLPIDDQAPAPRDTEVEIQPLPGPAPRSPANPVRNKRAKPATKRVTPIAKQSAKRVKPDAEKPAARKPAARKPAARKPAAKKPAAKEPAAKKPAKKLAANKTATEKSPASKRAATPAANKPAKTPIAKKRASAPASKKTEKKSAQRATTRAARTRR